MGDLLNFTKHLEVLKSNLWSVIFWAFAGFMAAWLLSSADKLPALPIGGNK